MATALACCGLSGAGCLANSACSCFGSLTRRSSKLTRLAYTCLFLGLSLATWAWYAWGAEWYHDTWPGSVISINCAEDVCFGAMSVYRITSIMAVFYFVHAVVSFVQIKMGLSRVNAKFWGLKLILLVVGIVVTMFIPNPPFMVWAWMAIAGSAVFLILQLVLLVDFAHSWSESWLEKWNEDPDHKGWWWGLVCAMTGLYLIAFGLTIAEGVFFGKSGCDLNIVLIAVNCCLIMLESGISIHPSVQEANPNSGLLQSATVAAYSSYLIWSALMSQPEETGCNNLTGGKESFSAISGALIVFISVCYSAFRVSTKSDDFLIYSASDSGAVGENYGSVNTDVESQQPVSGGGQTAEEMADEEEDKRFNYTFFHICFMLATCYITMLITNWMMVSSGDSGSNYVIDRSMGSVWVKVASSWLAHVLYIWSLMGPVLLPEREWYT